MFSRKKVSFQTEKQSKNGKFKKNILLFTVGFIIILAASLLLILSKNDFDFKIAFIGEAPEQTTEEARQVPQPALKKSDHTFLIWTASKDKSTVRFIFVLRVQMPERKMKICAIDPASILSYNGKNATFNEIYSRLGEREFVSAVEKFSDLKIDRYIGATDENFKAFINYIGGIEVVVPEQVDYRSDEYNVILIKGRQNVKGDTLFKYLLYLGTVRSESGKEQSKVFSEVLDNIFTENKIQKKNNIYSKISNTMNTNITIVDFSSESDNIDELMRNGTAKTEFVGLPSEIKPKG